MGWLERMGRVVRGHLDGLINETEDPEQLLHEAIHQIEQELIAMRQALAAAIATNKSAERELSRYEKNAQTWYERAELAMAKGSETLAREALLKRQSYQQQADSIQSQLREQNEVIKRLRDELRKVEHKEKEAKAKKSLYLARLQSAMASQKLQEVLGNFDSHSSENLFERIEEQILELETQSEIMSKIPDPLEKKFLELENSKKVEREMAKLKAKQSQFEINEIRSKLDKI